MIMDLYEDKADYMRGYYDENKEQMSARSTQWKLDNADKNKAHQASYRERNREKLRQKAKEYRERQKENGGIKMAGLKRPESSAEKNEAP